MVNPWTTQFRVAAKCATGHAAISLGVYRGPVLAWEPVACISLLLEVMEGLLYLLASYSSSLCSWSMAAAHTVQFSTSGSIGFNSLSLAFVPKPATLPSEPQRTPTQYYLLWTIKPHAHCFCFHGFHDKGKASCQNIGFVPKSFIHPCKKHQMRNGK